MDSTSVVNSQAKPSMRRARFIPSEGTHSMLARRTPPPRMPGRNPARIASPAASDRPDSQVDAPRADCGRVQRISEVAKGRQASNRNRLCSAIVALPSPQ